MNTAAHITGGETMSLSQNPKRNMLATLIFMEVTPLCRNSIEVTYIHVNIPNDVFFHDKTQHPVCNSLTKMHYRAICESSVKADLLSVSTW